MSRESTPDPPTDDTKIFFWKNPLTSACSINASKSPFQKLVWTILALSRDNAEISDPYWPEKSFGNWGLLDPTALGIYWAIPSLKNL